MISGPALLDAAMGTALRARGLPRRALPEEWILTHPEEIAAVHAAHASAGASVLLTCTFNCTEPRLATRGIEDRLEALCGWAERLARSAGRAVLVAGAVGPTGLARPGRPGPGEPELLAHYGRPLVALRDAGVDLLWIESQYHLGEARAALRAARRAGLPAVVTMAFAERGGRLVAPQGEPAAECLEILSADGAAAVGVNCVEAGAALVELARDLAPRLAIPLVLKPSAGLPGALLGPAAFAAALAPAVAAGARLLGGCCGTTAEHLQALGAIVQKGAAPLRPAT